MAAARPSRKKGRQAVRNKPSGFPAWGWLIISMLGGALLMWFVMLRRPAQPPVPLATNTPVQAHAGTASAPAPAPAVAATAPKKPQYDFYSVLPEKDVRIPDAELSAKVRAEQQVPATAPSTQPVPAARPVVALPPAPSRAITAAPSLSSAPANSGTDSYLLQIGAFPNSSDAEALKAKLAMQGFVANVQNVTINGQAYHRVRLGPFQSATLLESTKKRLSAAGIHAIALKEGH